jgi:hypothetical protein
MNGAENCYGQETTLTSAQGNRPGLDALVYRFGTHGSFKAAMKSSLARELRALTTRDDDDPAIALIDAWATVLDILAFYQERIANEGYLRTATERRSVLELAREIGYELDPGVAAETYLAFTVQDMRGTPVVAANAQVMAPSSATRIEIGTQVQSVPGPDEKAQIFETVEEIEARVEWNALKPRRTQAQDLGHLDLQEIYFKGITAKLKPGDLLVLEEVPGIWLNQLCNLVFPARTIELDVKENQTHILLGDLCGGFPAGATTGSNNLTKGANAVYVLNQRAALFGHNAPDWRNMAQDSKRAFLGLPPNTIVPASQLEWPGFNIPEVEANSAASGTPHGLSATYYKFESDENQVPKPGEPELMRIDANIDFDWGLDSPSYRFDDEFMARWEGWLLAPCTGDYTFYTLSDDGVRLWIDNQKMIDNWTSHPEAPDQAGPIHLEGGKYYHIQLDFFESGGRAMIKLFWQLPGSGDQEVIPPSQFCPISQLMPSGPSPIPYPVSTVHLDGSYPGIVPGSSLVLFSLDKPYCPKHMLYKVSDAVEDARSAFGLSTKSTRVELQGDDLDAFYSRLRETTVFAQGDKLTLAEVPSTGPLSKNNIIMEYVIDDLEPGRKLIVSGKPMRQAPDKSWLPASSEDETVSELVTLASVSDSEPDDPGYSIINLVTQLQNDYDPATVTIYANVAKATHGQTQQQVLGNGDASQSNQKFTLKQMPLTYTSCAQGDGRETTLQVKVNDLVWDQVDSLYPCGPNDRVYAVRLNDDGSAVVHFGDGIHGARPPSGEGNIVATYRAGTGTAGNLKAGQLSLLLTRPLGLQEAINPIKAEGGGDPEQIQDARWNAPLKIRTFDRIVSLKDYEDFACAFAGIGKAHARYEWDGEKRVVHITVTGSDGDQVPQAKQDDLKTAIQDAAFTRQPPVIESVQALHFNVVANLFIKRNYDREKVASAAKIKLAGTFSFDRREFGQDVNPSEIAALLQSVEGVTGVVLVQQEQAKGKVVPPLLGFDAHKTPLLWVIDSIDSVGFYPQDEVQP